MKPTQIVTKPPYTNNNSKETWNLYQTCVHQNCMKDITSGRIITKCLLPSKNDKDRAKQFQQKGIGARKQKGVGVGKSYVPAL